MARKDPPQQPPPVQRLRIRYAKRGRLRFTSHRDFSRAFERALVRAGLPMAYSSGFNPHPRISYAGASPTGAASEAEYLEIGLASPVDPAQTLQTLDEALPTGLDVLEVVESPGGALADVLTASRWQLRLPMPASGLSGPVADFLAAESVEVSRMTKRGVRDFDARAAVVSLVVSEQDGDHEHDHADDRGGDTEIELVLRHQEPAVRPDDVLNGLARIGGLESVPVALLTRLEQGVLDAGGGIEDPFAAR